MNKIAKTPLWGKGLIIFVSLVLCVGLGATQALAFTAQITTYDNNFTMIANGGLSITGGMNDVVFKWDGTQKHSVAKKNQVSNVSFATATKFAGVTWSTHDCVLYGPGTYTVYTLCPGGSPGCGLTDSTHPQLTFTVGPDELGVHYQFNWNVSGDIDMVNVFKRHAAFSPSPMCTNNPDINSCGGQGSCDPQPAGLPACPSPDTPRDKVWDLMSKDVNGDGINGLPFVDGPFEGFNGNMNVMLPPTGIPPHVWPSANPINFGGSSGDRILTITNNGDTDLTSIVVNKPIDPFSIVADTCTGSTVGPMQQCTVTIHWTRPQTGSPVISTILFINSNDAEAITKIGLEAGNDPPNPFELVSPEDGATNVDPKSDLRWNITTDPNENDKVSYHVYICTDPTFASPDCVPATVVPATVASRINSTGLFYAGGAGLFMIGITFFGGLKGRKRTMLLLVLAVLLVAGGGALMSCSQTTSKGDTASPPPAGQMNYFAPNLSSGTTYYWKVVADDGQSTNNLTSSNSRSFTTK